MSKETQSGIAAQAVDVSASDVTFDKDTRAIWVGTAGDLAVTMADGGNVTFPSASGFMFLQCKAVLNSGTAASGIVAVF